MPTTYEPIATTTLSTNTASITFSGISSAYTDLRLIVSCIIQTTGNPLYVRFNSDTATNYSWVHMFGNGTSAISNSSSSADKLYLGEIGTTTIPSLSIMDIMSYSGSTYKSVLGNFNNDKNGTGLIQRIAGLWSNTSAISSITIGTFAGGSYNMASGTVATLYGIKRA